MFVNSSSTLSDSRVTMSDDGMVSFERMYHFRCIGCDRWWSIADAPEPLSREWYCPWCGKLQRVVDKSPRKLV